MVSWNVNGWTTHNQTLRKLLLNHLNPDIICLSETHLKGNDTICLDNYHFFGYSRENIHVRAPKASGGVAILIKDCIFHCYNVNIIDKRFDGILGLKLHHKYTDYTVVIFACYLPPEGSSRGSSASEFYSYLITQSYMHSEADAVFICGDLNARIKNMQDIMIDVDNLPTRKPIDIDRGNSHGLFKGL